MIRRLTALIFRYTDSSFMPKSHDIEVAERIAKKLEDADKYKTLVNVMEWIDRDMVFWYERAYLDLIASPILSLGVVLIASIVMLPILILLSVIITWLLGLPLFYSFIASLLIAGLLFWYFLFKMRPFEKLLLIALGSPFFYNLSVKMLESWPKEVFIHFLNLSFVYWIIAGGSILILLYLLITYTPLTRYYENLPKLYAIIHLINLTFTAELSAKEILRLKRGVCKDYARLTASILVNLFPNNEIYFFLVPRHAATGIEIDGRIYVLDQKLPVMPLEAWLNRWNTNCPCRVLVLLRDTGGLKLAPVSSRMCRNVSMRIDLSRELDKLVEKTCHAILSGEPEATHVLKDYAKIFDVNDSVIAESLIRMIRIRLEKELTSKALLVRSIAISKDKDDLIISISILDKNKEY